MAWNAQLTNLRNVLAGIYWNQSLAYTFIRDVGINPIYVNLDTTSVVTWQSILERAESEGLLEKVLAKAHAENPNVQSLAPENVAQLHRAVTPPDLPDAGWHGPKDEDRLEKLMGATSTLRPISFLRRGLDVARSVGRITRADGQRGTGFLIQNNLLITNHHVLPSSDLAEGAIVEFNYQKTVDGLDEQPEPYFLAPRQTFVTSAREEQGGDDWTVVAVEGNPNSRWGALPLRPASPRVQDEVIIIQHPLGGSKQIALSHNTIAFVDDRRVQYLTDTLEGSSGSPVFNVEWQIVALHHKGGWLRDPNTKQAVYRNQGIHINVLIEGLQKAGIR